MKDERDRDYLMLGYAVGILVAMLAAATTVYVAGCGRNEASGERAMMTSEADRVIVITPEALGDYKDMMAKHREKKRLDMIAETEKKIAKNPGAPENVIWLDLIEKLKAKAE
jgi:hypothetical protein